jgi:hypothetical protein
LTPARLFRNRREGNRGMGRRNHRESSAKRRTSMFHRSKHFIVATVAAAVSLAPVAAASPAVAMAPCQVRPLFSVIEYQQTVAVTGVYKAPEGATDVQLTCGVVRNGATYAMLSEKIPGPVAVVAGTAVVPAGAVTACYEVRITYLTGGTVYNDYCP